MKITLKILLIIFASILIALLGFTIYFNILTKDVYLNDDKLINIDRTVQFIDINGEVFCEESNGVSVVELEKIPEYTINAFIAIEDKRFYKHNGVDYKGLMRATINNIKSLSFKEGASTISQQLIKNTHLTSDKTLKRKFSEIKLSTELERKYTKKEILEKYLNTIYFGDNCYGITAASEHYFNKKPYELNINESVTLAAIIKAPSTYSPINNPQKCNVRKNIVLKEMCDQGYIDLTTYNINKNIPVTVCLQESTPYEYTYISLVKQELNKIIQNSPYGKEHLKVYTEYDPNSQNVLKENILEDQYSCDKTSVLINKNGKIKAYYSTCGNINRQVGSVIKPILVYAPAIENDVVTEATKILDEKTDFNGYCPSNYNEQYYGYLSVKDSLAKSSNVCSVKILNYTGIEKSLSYLKKTDIKLNKNDNSLCLALGALTDGTDLISLTTAYSVFNNDGKYNSFSCINKITDENNNLIYYNKINPVKIYDSSTVSIMNDMLLHTVKEGTAKKLSYLDFPVYAKTGTVGNNLGNTDAYSISYTSEYLLGVWYGNKNNSLMDNKITGGSYPTIISANVWHELYKNNNTPKEIKNDDSVTYEYIDKITYEDSGKLILADNISPERYKLKVLLKKKNTIKERSSRFSHPEIIDCKLSVNNNQNELLLCLTEYCDAEIYKEIDGIKKLVYDTTHNNKTLFIDKDIINGKYYKYVIVPYYYDGVTKHYGKEFFTQEIKSPKRNIGDSWWENDLN